MHRREHAANLFSKFTGKGFGASNLVKCNPICRNHGLCVRLLPVASVNRMSGQPLASMRLRREIRQPNPVRPARPPDQAHAALAATTPFRFSG